MHETLAQVGSKSHGTWIPSRLLIDAEVVVEEARPDEDREVGGDRVRDHEQRALQLLQPQVGLVQRDREEEAEREGEEDREARVHERPDEDADERVADERVGEDRLEVLQADVRAPARLEHVTRRRLTYEPSPLSL